MAAIQFYGAKNVLDAANNRECPKWGIFAGTQFLFKYDGSSMEESIALLDTILRTIQESEAVYTIRFYEENVKIKAATPYDGSFNFRLVEETERQNRYSHSREIENRLAALESGGEEEEEEGEGMINGIINKLIDDPAKIEGLLNVVRGVLGIRRPPLIVPQATGAISGVADNEDQRIINAIQLLREVDDRLPDHLEQLAKMAKNDPKTFIWLLSLLEKM